MRVSQRRLVGALVELFADDAELEFVGIPVGPFRGREAIGEAYRAQPPDDEIVLLDGGPRYAWSREPERAAGELHLEERDGAIARLRVLYEQFS
jgi:steroid Delta-isomerase